MFASSKGVAVLLGICIATITTAFLYLVPGVPQYAFLIVFILSFASSYLLINILLEFFFFREISNMYDILDKLRSEDFSFINETSNKTKNPFKKINQEIYSYASIKQKEINELKKLEAFRREFLADVSHELKTPIFAAQGFVLTLLDGAIKDKNVRTKFLKKAAKSLEGLDMLLDDLLTISQMETGEIKMKFSHFNLFETAQDAADQLESKAEKKNIAILIEGDYNQGLYAYADQQRIFQVMINLISNAIKYTKEGGKVEISFEAGKNEVTTYVKDNGIGIPPEHIKRIFERFYRVDKSRSKVKGGTGLGLAIVKHIIEAHNFKVGVISTINEGSTFSFKLKKGQEVQKELYEEEY